MRLQVIRAVCNRLCRNDCINIPFPDTVQGEGKGNTPCSSSSLALIRRVQSQVNARTARSLFKHQRNRATETDGFGYTFWPQQFFIIITKDQEN